MPWTIPATIPLPRDFVGFDPSSPAVPAESSSYERHLPHWRVAGVCYFSTFRTVDSFPVSVLKEMKCEAEAWRQRVATAASSMKNGKLSLDQLQEWNDFQRCQARKLERILDEGHGECLLSEVDHRQIVVDSLLHFEGERYEMFAFTVMPNHVHVLCRPSKDYSLEEICGAWKSYSAQRLQRHFPP